MELSNAYPDNCDLLEVSFTGHDRVLQTKFRHFEMFDASVSVSQENQACLSERVTES